MEVRRRRLKSSSSIINEIQDHGNSLKDNQDNDSFVQHRYGNLFRRRFLVGRNDRNKNIEKVPKYVSLLVSRLKPCTRPEVMPEVSSPNFPEAICELHQSKHLEL